jgi:hypothetical protein
MQEVLQIGALLRIIQNQRIACDLDQPADIARFLKSGGSTHTRSYLESIGIRERLAQDGIS